MNSSIRRGVIVRSSGGKFPGSAGQHGSAGSGIGSSGVKVPTHLYKLVYGSSTQRAWAHCRRNEEGEGVRPLMSYQELVKRTGIESLPRCTPEH